MLLRVEELCTYFRTPAGVVRAVDGVSLEIPAGGTVALVGESGCGKSLTALSMLRLVPPPGYIAGGRILLDGQDLLSWPASQMRTVRGNRIAMVFQEPMTSLNPVLSIGDQISEPLRVHQGLSAREARTRAIELLRRVGIPVAPQRCRAYPHQLSGGMRQRVVIAMALACEPELLLADEPTTALDVTVQAQILALLRGIQQQSNMALLFITHDLAVVARVADAVCVMYAGRIVERAAVAALYADPRHPYTRGLLRCTPRLEARRGRADDTRCPAPRARRLPVIPGDVPHPLNRPAGCPFHPRCERGREDPLCRTREPGLQDVAPAHACACWHAPGYVAREQAWNVDGAGR